MLKKTKQSTIIGSFSRTVSIFASETQKCSPVQTDCAVDLLFVF